MKQPDTTATEEPVMQPADSQTQDDWSFSATAIDGDSDTRIDVWILDDGDIAVAIRASGFENGVRLRRDAAERLRRTLGRLLGEPASTDPEKKDSHS